MWKSVLGLGAATTVAMSLTLTAAAIDATSNDPRAILRAAFEMQTIARSMHRMKMSIKDGAGTRERIMTVRGKRFADGYKRLVSIEAPEEVRNTGFLSFDYTDRARADDQWLYLPKLHRVARVPNSGRADAFVGSDFSLSDLSGQNPEDFKATLVQASAPVDGDDCWLVEATPRDEEVRDATGYAKTQLWVSKKKLVTVQLKAWLAKGERVKYLKASDIRNDAGFWTAHRLQMRTLEGAKLVSETLLEFLSVDNDAKDVSDGDFTPQRLERGA
jgi:hypothetical protein